jgi:hypothetical protein
MSGRLPHFGLFWVTWRQHRMALAGVLALLGGFSIMLAISGLRIHAAYASLGIGSCRPAGSARCGTAVGIFGHEYYTVALLMPRFLEFAPALIGTFVGAPLLARELESGTFRFAWTQGAGRIRWLVTKLSLLGLAVTAAALAFSAVFGWWYGPFEQYIGRMWAGQAFEVAGVVFAARTLLAFMLGALAGAVIGRVVPAMAATLGAWFALVWPSTLLLRPHYQAPLTSRFSMVADDNSIWALSQWWQGPDGRRISDATVRTLTRRLASRNIAPDTWLTSHRYSLWQTYQPASRFWTFQAIESTGLLAVSLLLAAAAIWWARRGAG